jgi:hypothetical protein
MPTKVLNLNLKEDRCFIIPQKVASSDYLCQFLKLAPRLALSLSPFAGDGSKIFIPAFYLLRKIKIGSHLSEPSGRGEIYENLVL